MHRKPSVSIARVVFNLVLLGAAIYGALATVTGPNLDDRHIVGFVLGILASALILLDLLNAITAPERAKDRRLDALAYAVHERQHGRAAVL